MSENQSCQARSKKELSFWKLVTVWTAALIITSFLVTLYLVQLVGAADPTLGALTIVEILLVAFFAPPLLTIWGLGITVFAYKCGMLCVLPTGIIVASYLLSAPFGFPLSTILTLGTVTVMAYTLLQNRMRMRVHESAFQPNE